MAKEDIKVHGRTGTVRFCAIWNTHSRSYKTYTQTDTSIGLSRKKMEQKKIHNENIFAKSMEFDDFNLIKEYSQFRVLWMYLDFLAIFGIWIH